MRCRPLYRGSDGGIRGGERDRRQEIRGAEEREKPSDFIGSGKRSAQLLTKARILLKSDVSEAGEGSSDSKIAEAFDTSIANIGTEAPAIDGGRVRGNAEP
jgi:hypothetical protein